MERKITKRVQGFRAVDGAGVNLVRVLGHETAKDFDPILMLDSFDSTNPDDYTAGFPMHPHRGIETVSYLYRGKMVHSDTLGNVDSISDGEVQWMCSGSGILHEEKVPASERLLGVQLWLNLPAKDKMCNPSYRSIGTSEIQDIEIEGGTLRLLAGSYKDHAGHQGDHVPFDYYDVHLHAGAQLVIDTQSDDSVMAFTLLGDAIIAGEQVAEKTAVKLGDGDTLTLKGAEGGSQILVMKARALNEPIAWAGPIVMNTQEELSEAFDELDRGTFIRDDLDFQPEH